MGNVINIAKPQTIQMGYNPVVFGFSGDTTGDIGYRYIADIYSAGTTSLIASFNITPDIDSNGYLDVSKILTNFTSYDVQLTNYYNYNCPNSSFNYDLKIGYENQDKWDSIFINNLIGTQYDSYITISGTSNHPFSLGDKIIIDGIYSGPSSLLGLHTVIGVPNVKAITIDAYYSDTSHPIGVPLNSKYSDGRRNRFTNLLNNMNYNIFNGSKSFNDFLTYDKNDYIITGTSITNKALSSIPDNFTITPDQDIWLNFWTNKSSTPAFIYFKNSNNDIFRRSLQPITSTNINSIYVAGNQLDTVNILVSGTTGLIKSDTTYYDTWVTNGSGQQMTKKYRFNIDQRCKIEDYEIVFMDRMGSIVSFAFPLRAQESGTITRSDFKNQIGKISNGKWTYNTYNVSTTNININVDKKIILNTNWMNDEMSVYFEELLTSPYTWVKMPDGLYQNCAIIETNFITERQKNKNLIRKTITIKLSDETIINI